MRIKSYRGKCVTLKIRLTDFSTYTRSRSFTAWVNSSTQIFAQVQEMYKQFDRDRQRVRLLGLSMSNLEKGESQLDLFAHEIYQRDKIDVVLDKIRERFGEKSITRASLLQTEYDSEWIRD